MSIILTNRGSRYFDDTGIQWIEISDAFEEITMLNERIAELEKVISSLKPSWDYAPDWANYLILVFYQWVWAEAENGFPGRMIKALTNKIYEEERPKDTEHGKEGDQ
jgi:hypothetical protein